MQIDDRIPEVAVPINGYLTADWHWPERPDRGPWAAVDLGGDTRFALEQIVGLCAARGADLYAAGDLVDGPEPEPESVAQLYATLAPLRDAGLKLYYVLGNHERGRDWLLPFGPAAVRLDGRFVETPLGVVSGSSYVSNAEFHRHRFGPRVADIGLYHQTWAELVPAAKVSVKSLPRNRLALCGDVHVRTVLTPNDGPARVLSPGSLSPQSVTEFVSGHYAYGAGPDLVPHATRLKGRKFVYASVETDADVERVAAAAAGTAPDADLPEAVSRPFFSLKVHDGVAESAVRDLVEFAASRGIVTRTVWVRRRTPRAERAAEPGSDKLEEVLGTWPAPEPVRKMATDLVTAADPASVLRDAYQNAKCQ